MIAQAPRKWLLPLASLLLLATLGGCTGSSVSSTKEWMQEEQKKVQPNVTPLPQPKAYAAMSYTPPQGVAPFSIMRLVQAVSLSTSSASNANPIIAAELNRPQEPLEAFPLDTIDYVGNLTKAGKAMALVKVESKLYKVALGEHMGQNYGRITQITETQIVLHEVAQDAMGDWVERTTTLNLKEGPSK